MSAVPGAPALLCFAFLPWSTNFSETWPSASSHLQTPKSSFRPLRIIFISTSWLFLADLLFISLLTWGHVSQLLFPGSLEVVHGLLADHNHLRGWLRSGKIFKINFNRQCTTTMFTTNPCPQVPHPQGFWSLPVIPTLPGQPGPMLYSPFHENISLMSNLNPPCCSLSHFLRMKGRTSPGSSCQRGMREMKSMDGSLEGNSSLKCRILWITLWRCQPLALSTDTWEKLDDWMRPKTWFLRGKAEKHFVLLPEWVK